VAKRTIISKYPNSSVAAGTSSTTPIGAAPLPDGRTIRISCFGGALQFAGKVELQLRTQVTPSEKWRTVRCVVGPGQDHFENFQPIVGDGTIAALRIRRTNDDASDHKISAWVEGFRRKD
jgi:hypothetical protein